MNHDAIRAFSAASRGGARLIGIDLGTKTIGLALSDLGRQIATPLETIRRVKFTPDAQRLAALCRQHAVGGLVVGDPGQPGMDLRAAEFLGRHDLAGRRPHEGRATEENRALAAHNHALVRHGRHVGAPGRTRAHDAADLRNTGRREPGLVVEDAAEMITVGKNFCLLRQVGAARIDQIEAG